MNTKQKKSSLEKMQKYDNRFLKKLITKNGCYCWLCTTEKNVANKVR